MRPCLKKLSLKPPESPHKPDKIPDIFKILAREAGCVDSSPVIRITTNKRPNERFLWLAERQRDAFIDRIRCTKNAPANRWKCRGVPLGWSAEVASGRTFTRNSSFFRKNRILTRFLENFRRYSSGFGTPEKPPLQGEILRIDSDFGRKATNPRIGAHRIACTILAYIPL